MIINDTHQVAFVHVPKCAGTTLRRALQPFDETGGAHTNRVACHQDLGMIDYVHIPLFVLRNHFRQEYEKVRTYRAYAVLRDPFARFPSSLSQHFKMYRTRPIHEMSLAEVRQAVDETLSLLGNYAGTGAYLPYQYIHFQRQADFVYDEGERLIDSLYTTDRLDQMIADIGSRIGTTLVDKQSPPAKANQSKFYRSPFVRTAVECVKPVLRSMLKPERRAAVRRVAQDWVFVTGNRELQAVFNSNYVRDFIADYYRDDLRLFRELG